MLFDITAEENEILKIWKTVLLPLLSSLKHIFHPVSDAEGCQDIGLQKSS